MHINRFGSSVIAGVVLMLSATLVAVWKSPFRLEAITRRVERETGARVRIGTYQQKTFPPGFSAKEVRLSDSKGNVATIDAIELDSSYIGLLQMQTVIGKVHIRGLNLVIPSLSNSPVLKASGPGVVVREVRLDSAALNIQGSEFLVHSLVLNNVGKNRTAGFGISMHNPAPPGEIHARGQFGPVISGDFTFSQADLHIERGISAATLNASGKFYGPLSHIQCTGTADLPVFQVFGSSHPVHIASAFDVSVNASTGDVVMNRVLAHFNGTTVAASGRVQNREVSVETAVQEGRVEDLLLLFTKRPDPAMEGPITLHANFVIPPGPPGFLTKLRVNGEFAISRGYFTNPKAQTPIDRLSASGRGEAKQEQREHPSLTTAEIRGSVVTQQQGIATLPQVVFEAPGLRGQLAGTFGLQDKRINMAGHFETKGKIEDTTSGIKVLLLKALGPLWPRKASVQTVPFRISGDASHPVFRVELHH
jgi:hypothetical protein